MPRKCPICDTTMVKGRLCVPGQAFGKIDIRFLSDETGLIAPKAIVQALACSKCGHVELQLEHSEIGDANTQAFYLDGEEYALRDPLGPDEMDRDLLQDENQ